MSTGVVCTPPILQFFGNNGEPLAGGSVLTQVGGVNTATYSDVGLTTPLPNPIPLNSRGEISTAAGASSQLFLTPNVVYTFTVSDRKGNLIWVATYVSGISPTGESIAVLLSTITDTPILNSLIRTPAEIAAGVMPVNYTWSADPYVDPRRYGADPTGVADSTTAVQAALNVAHQCNGTVWIGNNCNFKCGALSLTFNGSLGTNSFRILGSSSAGSVLTLTGSPAAFLTLTGSTPTGNPTEAPIVLENFSLNGPGLHSGTTTDGLLLQGVAYWRLVRMVISGFNHNVYLNSALTCEMDDCLIVFGQYGVYARQDGAGSGNNMVKIRGGTISGHAIMGIDWDRGDLPFLQNVDMENNGTSGNTSTGAIAVRTNSNFGAGEFTMVMDGLWFEGNQGQCVKFESIVQSTVNIRNCIWYTNEAGRCLLIAGGTRFNIENCNAQSALDTFDITATFVSITNTAVSNLTDSGITYPTYTNVSTAAASYIRGRSDSFTGTLTGVSGTITGTILVVQEGSDITLIVPSALVGTSTSTACTITGLPSKYQPATNKLIACAVFDNGALKPGALEIDAGTGTMTLQALGFTFTSSGSKGMPLCDLRYKLINS